MRGVPTVSCRCGRPGYACLGHAAVACQARGVCGCDSRRLRQLHNYGRLWHDGAQTIQSWQQSKVW